MSLAAGGPAAAGAAAAGLAHGQGTPSPMLHTAPQRGQHSPSDARLCGQPPSDELPRWLPAAHSIAGRCSQPVQAPGPPWRQRRCRTCQAQGHRSITMHLPCSCRQCAGGGAGHPHAVGGQVWRNRQADVHGCSALLGKPPRAKSARARPMRAGQVPASPGRAPAARARRACRAVMASGFCGLVMTGLPGFMMPAFSPAISCTCVLVVVGAR